MNRSLVWITAVFLASNSLATADPIKVEQAGDRFVNFVLTEIESARKKLPEITRAAELAAQRIVERDGELLSAGDHSFSLEPVWRAGGIAFSRQYLPDKDTAADKRKSSDGKIPYYRTKEFVEHFTVQDAECKDVVLLGFENEKQERLHLASTVKRLLSDEALIVFFGSEKSAKKLEQEFGERDNLVFITHRVPDGGIIEIENWPEKICSGRSIANRLYLWTFEAELISAFMRRGKMPGILLSVTYESPQIWNLPLLHDYKFIPAFDVTPVKKGVLGDTYLGHLRRIVRSIVPDQRKQFVKAAHWLAEAERKKRQSFALLIHGLDPDGLPGDPGLFKVYSEGNAYYPKLDKEFAKNDVALFVGYNWYPRGLAKTVDDAGGKQILCFTLVQEQPPKPVVYGEVGELRHYTSFDDLPKGENRIYIDLKFAQYNAVLKIPGYPIPALETSSFAEDVVYWHLVADTVELLAEDSKPFGLERRQPWTTSRVAGTPDPPPPYTVERAFENLEFKNPVYIAQEPGTDRFLVGELSGKIYAFTKETPNTDSRELFLDIGRDLYSFSFHPEYEKNGYVFTFSPKDPKEEDDPKEGEEEKERKSRVSRYRATGSPRRCVPETETTIVEWTAGGHNGGEAVIGPDGYLYISTGDGTGGSDLKGTGQGVDDLLSVIMRLDVDHPAGGKAYSIPKDNPFVDYPAARPEIWAFGFRNPWRMSFDSKTGDLWVGDVGQDLWEMIWKVQRGGNYGWSVQEGSYPFHPNQPSGPGPILPPVVEHHHTECRSITGGYVYYGDKFPELSGVYFYGDYEYGMIWGVRAEGQKATWNQVLANTPLRIASFGVSRDGDIYLLDHPSGEVHQLVRSPKATANQRFPRRLSETGIFTSVKDHKVATGVVPYSVNTPQWLDNATKQRFVALPGESKINFVERSGNASTWGFEDGSVNVETISLEMEVGNPESKRRIETRITVKQENHWLGYSYFWNDEQTDAALVEQRGRDMVFTIKDAKAPSGKRQQNWHIPSRNECMFCHSRAAGFVLGLNTPQMNRRHDYGDIVDNQLRTFDHVNLFEKPLAKSHWEYDALPDPYDKTADLDARTRAYLHVNCSVCHVSNGGGNAKIELKYFQELADTKLTDPAIHGAFGLTDGRVVTPGDPFSSVLFYRLSKWGRGRMPHIGSNLHDEKALDLIHDWITHLPSSEVTTKAKHSELASASKSLKIAEHGSTKQQGKAIRRLLSNTRGAFILSRLVATEPSLGKIREQAVALAMDHPDPNVRDLFERFLPVDQRTKRLGNVINLASILKLKGNIENGRRFFFTATASQCKNCHRIDQTGGQLGPDLSGIGKKYKRHELLESLIDPSRKVDPKYQTHILATTAGKIYTGIVVEKSEKQVVMNIFKEGKTEAKSIPADDVDELVPQKKSLMPDGLLRDLSSQQAADLLAFLGSLTTEPKK